MEVLKNRIDIVTNIGNVLNNPKRPMKERFRALFTLRNIGGELAIRCIEKCFDDESALLKHECAYCLGQMQDPLAIPKLISILENGEEDSIVRHEAGEALAAIGHKSSLTTITKFLNDPAREVAETCQLALQKMTMSESSNDLPPNPYRSVDPAPPLPNDETSIHKLKSTLLDESVPLFERYRAMFSLRNLRSGEATLAIAEGLTYGSALFRHEIAYVLGQIQDVATVDHLIKSLEDIKEHEMVRHECAEALGSIATEKCIKTLTYFLNDEKRVVRESCEVALDMCDYENSKEFQYANMLCSTA